MVNFGGFVRRGKRGVWNFYRIAAFATIFLMVSCWGMEKGLQSAGSGKICIGSWKDAELMDQQKQKEITFLDVVGQIGKYIQSMRHVKLDECKCSSMLSIRIKHQNARLAVKHKTSLSGAKQNYSKHWCHGSLPLIENI